FVFFVVRALTPSPVDGTRQQLNSYSLVSCRLNSSRRTDFRRRNHPLPKSSYRFIVCTISIGDHGVIRPATYWPRERTHEPPCGDLALDKRQRCQGHAEAFCRGR